jgi:endo-1,4-beta-xylanase
MAGVVPMLAAALALSGLPVLKAAAALDALVPERVAARVREHRTALATLTVLDAAGRPLANRPVAIEQTAHRFLFGCNAFRLNPADGSAAQLAYQQRFTALLNFATLPFYWGSYEPARGQPREDRIRAMAQWCRDQGLSTKGHPLCWHQVTPRWAADLPWDEVRRLQRDRITREVTAFAGLIDVWDVVNEAVIMPRFERDQNPISALGRELGRVPLIQETFATARHAHPGAVLILNDYDTSAEFERLIEDTLTAGVDFQVIGIQSHMHGGYRGADWAWRTCETFARHGKPLHFTETTIVSGPAPAEIRWHGPRHDDWHTTPEGEQLQADQVEDFYRILFSHPAVEAITWWDFTDDAWLGAPAGLLRKDMSPKPAYDRLLALIKGEWWTGRQTHTTDDHGKIQFRGFLGRYHLAVEDSSVAFELPHSGEVTLAATLPRPTQP